MEPPLVGLIIISVLSCSTDRAGAQGIYASENPIAVGKNVTLFSNNPVATGAWLFDNNLVVIIVPGGAVTAANWTGRVAFNSTTSALTVMSLGLGESGTYTLQDVGSSASQLVLSVQEPITGVTMSANGSDLVEFNDTVTLTCTVATGTSLSFQWLNDTAEVTPGGYVHFNHDGSLLTLTKATRYDEGPFKCNVTNGISQGISSSAQFNISYGPTNAAVSVAPPLHTHITGSNITLTCLAESKPPATVQWMLDGMTLNHTGAQLQRPMVAESHSGDYQCLLHNSVTSRFSSASAMIRIMAPITAVMVNHTGGVAVAEDPFTLNCHVSGEAEIIQWMKNDNPVSADNTTIFDAKNLTLTLNPAQPGDAGQYKCVAFNAVSNMTSSPYTLEVYYGPNTPVITAPSLALTGNQVLLNCSSSSHPPSVYSWRFNETEVANTAEYLTGPLAFNMSGTYTCMAFNNVTGRNNTADHMLTVLAPVSLASVTAAGAHPILNNTFSLTCQTVGSVESITWEHHGALLYTDGNTSLSLNNATLTFQPVSMSHNGNYTCEASNPLSGFTSENYTLNVIYGPWVPNVTSPTTTLEGSSVTLNCSAMSYPPSQYTWFFNGTPVANTSVYLTSALSTNMSGTYTCTARNTITGDNSSADTMLTVLAQIKHVHIEVPVHPPVEEYPYTLTCNVSGPAYEVLWRKNGLLLITDARIVMSMDNRTVTFNQLHRNDSGQYHCWAINPAQQLPSPPHLLIVNFGPETQMVSGPPMAVEGQSVNFSCSATSRPGSHFSWWHNVSLVANSSDFVTSPLTLNMSGQYTCMARNPVSGKNITRALMLQVIEDIESVTVENDTIPIDGDNFTLTCVVDGPYTSIQWKKDGAHLAANYSAANHSATNHSQYYMQGNRLHFAPLTRYDDGTYECVASNLVGPHKSPQYDLLVNYGPVSVTILGPDLSKVDLSISISCVADSRPESEYEWFLNDVPSSIVGSGSIIQIPLLASNYTCKATNGVTNISMSHTKSFSLFGSASSLHSASLKVLVIISVFITSVQVVLFR